MAFDSFIPQHVINIVYHYSFNTKSVHVLCFIFEKYRNIFEKYRNIFQSKEDSKKKYWDYVQNHFIEEELKSW